jgi:hypothetical protein
MKEEYKLRFFPKMRVQHEWKLMFFSLRFSISIETFYCFPSTFTWFIMLLQTFDVLTIVYILIATIVFWLMLWLATRIVVSKDFASDKKFMLLLTALLMVVLVPIITSALVSVLVWVGGLMVDLRGLLGGGGHNYVTGLAPIISFLIFMIFLKFLVGMDWKDTTWVALIGIFLLYVFYSLVPELIFMGALL